jgi:hypothetical protein
MIKVVFQAGKDEHHNKWKGFSLHRHCSVVLMDGQHQHQQPLPTSKAKPNSVWQVLTMSLSKADLPDSRQQNHHHPLHLASSRRSRGTASTILRLAAGPKGHIGCHLSHGWVSPTGLPAPTWKRPPLACSLFVTKTFPVLLYSAVSILFQTWQLTTADFTQKSHCSALRLSTCHEEKGKKVTNSSVLFAKWWFCVHVCVYTHVCDAGAQTMAWHMLGKHCTTEPPTPPLPQPLGWILMETLGRTWTKHSDIVPTNYLYLPRNQPRFLSFEILNMSLKGILFSISLCDSLPRF